MKNGMVHFKKMFLENWLMRGGAGALLLAPALVLMFVGCECEVDIKTNTLPSGAVGQQYDFHFQESTKHCSSDCEWRVIGGNLPPGLTLTNGGELRGVPTTSGAFNFTVEVVAGDEADISGSDSSSVGLALTIN